MRKIYTLIVLLVLSRSAFAQEQQIIGRDITDEPVAKGVASYYHDKFVGRQTANGEIFSNDKFTAASNTLSLNTYVKVTNLSNGEYIYVRINDRMHKDNPRIIDLASVAAKKLGFHKKGITKVKVEIVPEEEGREGILAQNALRKAQQQPIGDNQL